MSRPVALESLTVQHAIPASLKRYPNAAVRAPLANLPPPATLASPPSTLVAISLLSEPKPVSNGPANESTSPGHRLSRTCHPIAERRAHPTRAVYSSSLKNFSLRHDVN